MLVRRAVLGLEGVFGGVSGGVVLGRAVSSAAGGAEGSWKYSASDLKPIKVDGVWRRPKLSLRRAVEAKKRGLLDPSLPLHPPRKATVLRRPKGRAHDNRLQQRLDRIAKGLSQQEAKLAEWRKQRPPKAKKTGLALVMRKNPWEKD